MVCAAVSRSSVDEDGVEVAGDRPGADGEVDGERAGDGKLALCKDCPREALELFRMNIGGIDGSRRADRVEEHRRLVAGGVLEGEISRSAHLSLAGP